MQKSLRVVPPKPSAMGREQTVRKLSEVVDMLAMETRDAWSRVESTECGWADRHVQPKSPVGSELLYQLCVK